MSKDEPATAAELTASIVEAIETAEALALTSVARGDFTQSEVISERLTPNLMQAMLLRRDKYDFRARDQEWDSRSRRRRIGFGRYGLQILAVAQHVAKVAGSGIEDSFLITSIMANQVDVEIDTRWISGAAVVSAANFELVRQAVATILCREGFVGDRSASVAILLTGDEQLHRLNREFAGEDHVTDVLSFEADTGVSFPNVDDDSLINQIGDIAISVPKAERQAIEKRVPFKRELAMLAIHGTLHLLCYDHAMPEEERVPDVRQDRRCAWRGIRSGRLVPYRLLPLSAVQKHGSKHLVHWHKAVCEHNRVFFVEPAEKDVVWHESSYWVVPTNGFIGFHQVLKGYRRRRTNDNISNVGPFVLFPQIIVPQHIIRSQTCAAWC